MSQKYEREIEEILRNIDDARPTVSDRIRAMNQRPPRRSSPSFSFNTDTLLGIGVLLAFVAATLRWIAQPIPADLQPPSTLMEILVPLIAAVGFVFILVALLMAWLRPRGPNQVAWRGEIVNRGGGGRSGGRSPFTNMRLRMNLMRMRVGYRRRQ